MVNFEITKTQKIKEVNNDMCHNYYFLIYGKIYNESKTKYKKFKYVIWFDIFDLQEYFEKDIIYKNDIMEYAKEIECLQLLNIENYNDEKGLKEFYNYCNETIMNYNKIR